MKIIRYERDEDGICVLTQDGDIQTWMDVWIENDDIICDWNKYIFFSDDPDDVKIQEYQKDVDNFEEVSSEVILFLENKGLVKQNDDATWSMKKYRKYRKKKSKEEKKLEKIKKAISENLNFYKDLLKLLKKHNVDITINDKNIKIKYSGNYKYKIENKIDQSSIKPIIKILKDELEGIEDAIERIEIDESIKNKNS